MKKIYGFVFLSLIISINIPAVALDAPDSPDPAQNEQGERALKRMGNFRGNGPGLPRTSSNDENDENNNRMERTSSDLVQDLSKPCFETANPLPEEVIESINLLIPGGADKEISDVVTAIFRKYGDEDPSARKLFLEAFMVGLQISSNKLEYIKTELEKLKPSAAQSTMNE